jgi:glutamine cyclotransferase
LARHLSSPQQFYMKRLLLIVLPTLVLCSCGNETSNDKPTTTPETETVPSQPAVISYQVVQTYPHDIKVFTEGLQFVDGKLLESGGNYGESDLRFTELKTGKVLQQIKLDKKYFGEGCTLLNGKIYQMTWMENTCFVYDAATFKKEKEFTYNFGQGWGMTTNGKELIISNGGSNLFFYDPLTFKEIKRVGVTNQNGPVGNINELELIKGFLYANIWQTDNIVKIDTASGKVVGVINLEDLRGKAGIAPYSGMDGQPDVLNGIAYDAAGNRVFVTGKNWPKLFEVKFDN